MHSTAVCENFHFILFHSSFCRGCPQAPSFLVCLFFFLLGRFLDCSKFPFFFISFYAPKFPFVIFFSFCGGCNNDPFSFYNVFCLWRANPVKFLFCWRIWFNVKFSVPLSPYKLHPLLRFLSTTTLVLYALPKSTNLHSFTPQPFPFSSSIGAPLPWHWCRQVWTRRRGSRIGSGSILSSEKRKPNVVLFFHPAHRLSLLNDPLPIDVALSAFISEVLPLTHSLIDSLTLILFYIRLVVQHP